jgi:hypothetical protein
MSTLLFLLPGWFIIATCKVHALWASTWGWKNGTSLFCCRFSATSGTSLCTTTTAGLPTTSTTMKLTGLPSAFGNLLTVIILLCADLASFVPKFLAYKAVGLIDLATGSGANTVRAKAPWHPQRFATTPVMARLPAVGTGFGELDVPKTMAASTFPLKPDVIIARAKAVLAAEVRHAEGATYPGHTYHDYNTCYDYNPDSTVYSSARSPAPTPTRCCPTTSSSWLRS